MDKDNFNRRNILKTLGAGVGASTLMNGFAAADSGKSEPIESNKVRGKKRGQLLREANNSDEVAFVAEQLGGRPGVSSVVKYSGEATGYAVFYRNGSDGDSVIQYHKGTTDQPKAFGSVRVGDGVRVVDSEYKTITDVRTPKASSEMKTLSNEARSQMTTENQAGEHNFEHGVLIRDVEMGISGGFIPVEKDGDVIDTVRVEEQPSGEVFSIVDSQRDGLSAQHHVVCDPIIHTLCTDYCAVLCGSLALGSFGVCTGTCATTIVGIPISVDCGALCAVAVSGVCYPTCVNLAH